MWKMSSSFLSKTSRKTKKKFSRKISFCADFGLMVLGVGESGETPRFG